MPPVISATPDLSCELGGPSLPSTASSLEGLFSFSSPCPGDQILLEVSDSEGYPSGSEASHVLSEEVKTTMTADDIPDAMVNSALPLNALLRFLHENRDIIELSTADIAMYIGAIMRAIDVITEMASPPSVFLGMTLGRSGNPWPSHVILFFLPFALKGRYPQALRLR